MLNMRKRWLRWGLLGAAFILMTLLVACNMPTGGIQVSDEGIVISPEEDETTEEEGGKPPEGEEGEPETEPEAATPAEEEGGGETSSGAISCGGTVSGHVAEGEESEWTFSGTAGTMVTIALNGTSGLDTYLHLMAPNGSEEASDDDSGTLLNALISAHTLARTGTYTIVARGYGHAAGSYSLSLTCTQGGIPPGQTGTTDSGAITCGQTIDGYVAEGEESEWTFSGTAGSGVTIALNGASGFDTYLQLMAPNGSEETHDDDGGPGLNSLISNHTLARTGTYTIIARGFGHAAGSYSLSLTCGSAPPPAANATVHLVNNSGQTVWYAYVSPTSDSNFYDSGDRLGSSTVPAGGTFDITVPAGDYDLLAEGSGHSTIETEWSVHLTGGSTYTWTVTSSGGGSGNATVHLVNNSGQTVFYAYVSPTSDSNFYTSGDRLGSSVVPSGSTFDITVPAGDYDLLAEVSGHNTLDTEWGVHLSAGSTYTWNVP
jgi:hypothetical protein